MRRKRESLRLARAHLQEQLRSITHPRHRELLERALAEIEKNLTQLH